MIQIDTKLIAVGDTKVVDPTPKVLAQFEELEGRAMDNIFIERLWRSVKYEEIYLNEYGSIIELRKALRNYFHFYNTERPHQTFDGATPLEMYKAA